MPGLLEKHKSGAGVEQSLRPAVRPPLAFGESTEEDKLRKVCQPYYWGFETLLANGVFNGVKRVLISGAGSAAELGALILLKKDHRLGYSIDGVEKDVNMLNRVKTWIDSNFRGHSVNLILGDVLELGGIREKNGLSQWDLIVDQESGPLAMTLWDSSSGSAISMLRIYAENLGEGGRLVVTKDFNIPEGSRRPPVRRVQNSLQSQNSPFVKTAEEGSLVVYEKRR